MFMRKSSASPSILSSSPQLSSVAPVSTGVAPAAAPVDPLALVEPSLAAVPSELRAVLDLFSAELAGVSFPDVDSAILRQRLDELARLHADLEQARATLEHAQAQLDRSTDQLGQLAARGIAYARIYAEAHPERAELRDRLARLASPQPAEAEPAPTRRGRKRAPRPELPFEREELAGEEHGEPAH